MLRCGVLRPVDDAEVLSPTALHRWLHQPSSALRNKLKRLHDHALTSGKSEFLPPRDPFLLACLVTEIDCSVWSSQQKPGIGCAKASQSRHVPHVVFIRVHHPFAREQVKGSELQI